MKYRTFGKRGEKVSALGFGAMRLPIKDGRVDEALAIRMVRHAIDQGVNYVDTAYPYHGGESERLIGKALQDGYRSRVMLATKMPCWQVEAYSDFDRIFDEQQAKLQTDRIDCYMLHALNRESWTKMRDLDALGWATGKVAEGKIRYFGFSFHDDYETFRQIVDATDWNFCQIQYNYMDIANQAGMRGLRYASSKGLAVVVMEPLLGGRLAGKPPKPIRELWERAETERAPADWALQWIWNQPEVSLLLSGMSTMAQVEQNLASAAASGVGTLGETELALIGRVREAYGTLMPIPCTKCGYCMPCPSGVNIPRILEIYNEAFMYDNLEAARDAYQWVPLEQRADRCTECGKCEKLCPQGIRVVEWLRKAKDLLEQP